MTRKPLLALAGLATFSLLLSSPAPAGSVTTTAEPAGLAAPTLQTGFEKRDGKRWTTLPEERGFLRALDRSSRRVDVSVIGRTATGRPLRLIVVGDPAPPRRAAIADGSAVLFVCSQHGDEPSGREACLQTARDLAAARDAATRRLLQDTTVLFIPSANPDGTAANTRENADGVDLNRDHLELATREGRAMARVIRDYRPDIVHDLHEYSPTPEVYDRQLIHLWPRNRNVDTRVYRLSLRLNNGYVDPRLRREGYTTGIYGIYYGPDGEPIAQSAGDGQERILRNMVGLRHSMGILVEANSDPTTRRERADESVLNRRRVLTQKLAVGATLDMLVEQRGQIASATERAPRRAAAEGSAGDQPFYFGGADNMLPTPEQVTIEPPCGYRLTAAQYEQVDRTLALHGIDVRRAGGGYTVSMAQAAQPVIPLLMDERGQYEVIRATPLTNCG